MTETKQRKQISSRVQLRQVFTRSNVQLIHVYEADRDISGFKLPRAFFALFFKVISLIFCCLFGLLWILWTFCFIYTE